MKKGQKKGVVFVGLSGGVDSSVSASLLLSQGYEVRGVFIKVWQPDIAITGGCTWREDRLDAMRVCAKLKIPFYTLDLEKEYKKEVVDYMISEYRAGRTPNPDVMCNKYIKFGGFFTWAMKQGADYVATGHYARVKSSKVRKVKSQKKNIKKLYKPDELYELLTGVDTNKDQSYFLWTLTQKQLSKTLFPVGGMEKPQVRKLAKRFGLETAEKKDSQGICFIGKVEMADFLKEYIKPKVGKVLNEAGEVIGTHEGVFYYTIGQRHGFSITKKTTHAGPYFIVNKDLRRNILVVSETATAQSAPGRSSDLEIKLKDVNWNLGVTPDLSKKYSARIRYRQPLESCYLKRQGSNFTVVFNQNQKAVTPGQSVVLYDGETCLGGGIIV